MEPFTKADLQSLRTKARRQRDEQEVQNYIRDIRSIVLKKAQIGNETFCTFWLINSNQAQEWIQGTLEYFYPWHTKFIRKTGNRILDHCMKRPIPVELLDRILDGLRPLFPDCDMKLLKDPVDQLLISWM
jgi:hypothetical protein